jgi:hypothetical protein
MGKMNSNFKLRSDSLASVENISCCDDSNHCATLTEHCITAIVKKGFLSVDIAASISLKIPDVSSIIHIYVNTCKRTCMILFEDCLLLISLSNMISVFRSYFF